MYKYRLPWYECAYVSCRPLPLNPTLLLASERVKDRSLEAVRWMIVVLPPPSDVHGRW